MTLPDAVLMMLAGVAGGGAGKSEKGSERLAAAGSWLTAVLTAQIGRAGVDMVRRALQERVSVVQNSALEEEDTALT
jgi:hypothetical protein